MADSRTSFIHKNLIHKITNSLQLPVFTYLKKLPYFLLTVKKNLLFIQLILPFLARQLFSQIRQILRRNSQI